MGILIDNVTILAEDFSVIKDGAVHVDGDRLAYVGRKGNAPAFKAEQTIDGRGLLAMPGLVNAHTHVSMTLLRSAANELPLQRWLEEGVWPIEDKLDAQAAYWGAMLGIAEMLRFGVTTFADMYFFTDNVAQAVQDSGIRAHLSRAVVGDGSERSRLDEAIELFHKWDGKAEGRLSMGIGPHAEYTCSPKMLEMCAEEAKKLGCLVHLHISETKKEHEDCIGRHGNTPAELFNETGLLDIPCVLAHGVHLTGSDITLLARKGASLVHNPGSNLKLGSGIARVVEMQKAGLNVALGTDGAASNNNLDVWQEMYLAAVLHKGNTLDATAVTAAEAMQMATLSGAKALELKDLGVLKAGNLADLILVDVEQPHYWPHIDMLNHLVYSGSGMDVAVTMVNGKVLYDRGRYTTLDLDEIRSAVAMAVLRMYAQQ